MFIVHVSLCHRCEFACVPLGFSVIIEVCQFLIQQTFEKGFFSFILIKTLPICYDLWPKQFEKLLFGIFAEIDDCHANITTKFHAQLLF